MQTLKAYTKQIIKEIGINTFIATKKHFAACADIEPSKFYQRLKLNRQTKKTCKDAAYFFRNELHQHFKEKVQYQ